MVLRAKRQLAGLIAALFELVRSQRRRSDARNDLSNKDTCH
jgi:hypothetical protein